jgi:hypothetical protein
VIGLFLLKHIYGLSDEGVCERWVYDPYSQYFTGEESSSTSFRTSRSDLSHWRKRLGGKLELLLAESLRVAHESGALRTKDLARVTVDTTETAKQGRLFIHQTSGIGQYAVVLAAAPSVEVEVRPVGVKEPGDIERAVTAFARASNGGLIVTASTLAGTHRKLIIGLAARHRLPAVYPFRYYPTSGGLISYGPGTVDSYRRAAAYVDRIPASTGAWLTKSGTTQRAIQSR